MTTKNNNMLRVRELQSELNEAQQQIHVSRYVIVGWRIENNNSQLEHNVDKRVFGLRVWWPRTGFWKWSTDGWRTLCPSTRGRTPSCRWLSNRTGRICERCRPDCDAWNTRTGSWRTGIGRRERSCCPCRSSTSTCWTWPRTSSWPRERNSPTSCNRPRTRLNSRKRKTRWPFFIFRFSHGAS